MYGHKTEAHFKTQASKMLPMTRAPLLRLRTLHWPNQDIILYQLISEVFLLLRNPFPLPS